MAGLTQGRTDLSRWLRIERRAVAATGQAAADSISWQRMGGARPEVRRRVAKSASRAPNSMGIAPKQRGGRKELTKGLEEVGEASVE
jgi:hypothetical protein